MPITAAARTTARWIAAAAAASAVVITLVVAGSAPASADVPGLETKVAQGTANANSGKTLAVSCSSGKQALGGGFTAPSSGAVQVIASVPIGATGDGSDNGWGWVVEFRNTDGSAQSVSVAVVCATIGS